MEIKYLVVHCADSPDDVKFTAADVHKWHLQRGWAGIGYHAVIRRDGTVERGRPEFWEGAHVQGHNHHSLGVCLIGRNAFTAEQFASLRNVLTDWSATYPAARVVSHRDLDPKKTCPNFDALSWWAGVKKQFNKTTGVRHEVENV